MILNRDQIREILLRELQNMDVILPQMISDEMRFREDFGLDSLDLAEYIARMEQAFRVEISDDEWQELATIGLVIDYVQNHR